MCAHARCADLVVIGQSDPDDKTLSVPQDFPEPLCLAAGRPVLVVPYAGAFTTAGERIVVAWNASRESARAVADVLPLLKQAKQVDVVTITPQQNASQRDSTSAGLIRYLGGHGVNANAINAHAAEKDVGDQLLSRALDRGADLLVMGAYGHSRFRELVLGGDPACADVALTNNIEARPLQITNRRDLHGILQGSRSAATTARKNA